MAIYHCSIKAISRAAGQSIVASAAYRSGEILHDKRTGEIFDYTRKRGIENSALIFPAGVHPANIKNREELWNAAESSEKRKDARLGREVVLALPEELNKQEQKMLVHDMAQHLANKYGVAVDFSIHSPSRFGDERNYHTHILMSARRITDDGFTEKTRELDDRKTGPQEVENIREQWAIFANIALEKANKQIQIDHRSLKNQGLKRMPTVHLGPSASSMERKGKKTYLGDKNRAVEVYNANLLKLEKELAARSSSPDPVRPLGELEGAAIVLPVKVLKEELKALYSVILRVKNKITSCEKNMRSIQYDIDAHNKEYSETGLFKRVLTSFKTTKRAEELLKNFEKNKTEYNNQSQKIKELKEEYSKKENELKKLEDSYKNTPHCKAMVALAEKEKREREAAEAKRVQEEKAAKEREAQERRQKINRETLVHNLVQCGKYWTGTVQEKKARREAILEQWDKASPEKRIEIQEGVKSWLAHQRGQERSRSRSGPSMGR